MKILKQDKQKLIEFLMKCSSLDDLLNILLNICENLDLNFKNNFKKLKKFQFTYFGLIVKVKGLLRMIIFKIEFLRKIWNELDVFYLELLKLNELVDEIYELIKNEKLSQGMEKLIECSKKYNLLFTRIKPLVLKKI